MVYWERLNGDPMKYLDLRSLLIHFYTEYCPLSFPKAAVKVSFRLIENSLDYGQGITRVNFIGVKIQKELKYRGTLSEDNKM